MKRKGVTGKVLTIIMSLIIAIIALALLWIFLKGGTEAIVEVTQNAILTIRCKFLCHGLFGVSIGLCSGC